MDLVIFDMDGLLIDSEPFWRKAEIKVFADKGIQLVEEDCLQTTGLSVLDVVKYWSELQSIHVDLQATANEIVDEVIKLILNEGDAMRGVHQILEFFRLKNIPMALASGSDYRLIEVVLEKLQLASYFVHIQSAESLPHGKPHPEIFLHTAKTLNANPMHCLVFEDSVNGVIAAKAARMKCVAVPESHNFERMEYAIADLKMQSLTDFNKNKFELLIN